MTYSNERALQTGSAPSCDLTEAHRLLEEGFHLVELHRNSKRPLGKAWNSHSNFVSCIDPFATGFGLPLVANNLCSIDVDHFEMAKVGLEAWGFDIEDLLNLGVRTISTRPESGGRSAYQLNPASGQRWLTLRVFDQNNRGVTVLELRADSPNLQDVIPGLVYADRETGELFTQRYAGEKTFSDAGSLPDDFAKFWLRMSKDDAFFQEQQRIFVEAIADAGFLLSGEPVRALPSCNLSGKSLAFSAKGIRSAFNSEHSVPDLLEKYGYISKGGDRWTYEGASGAPGIRPIPGKDGLWQSSHGGDPLFGTFDAWAINVLFEHGGDTEKAVVAYSGRVEDDFEVLKDETEQWPEINSSNYRRELPRRLVFITELDQYFDLATHALVRPGALDRQYSNIKRFSMTSKKLVPIKASSVVNESEDKTVVDCIGWQPCESPVIRLGKRRAVNTYIAPQVKREPGEPTIWLDLMRHIYGEFTPVNADVKLTH